MPATRPWLLLAAIGFAACGGAPRADDEPPLALLDADDCVCSVSPADRAAAEAGDPSSTELSTPTPDAAAIAARYHGDREREAKPTWTGRRIDLDVKDADLHNVFRLLADVGNIDIVVADDVAGTITLRLSDVPWDQALDAIVVSERLTVARNGRILLIGRKR